MSGKFVLGVDPGFASFGFAGVELHPDSLSVVRMGVIRTKKTGAKARVLQADDNFRRCEDIAVGLMGIVKDYKIVAICGESMSHVRNASAAAKVSMTWGVLAYLCSSLAVPMLQVSPQRLKEKIASNRQASKHDIQETVRRLFPGTDFDLLLEKYPMSEHEHPWDALACVIACLDAEPIRLVRRLMAS